MDKRKSIGIFFTYNENWIGGTYYIINLIHALNKLPESKKPLLHILATGDHDFDFLINETKYQYVKRFYIDRSKSFFTDIKNFISNNRRLPFFPLTQKIIHYEKFIDAIYWIPDFQVYCLPEFSTRQELEKRKKIHSEIAKTDSKLVVSSNSSLIDYQTYFPNAQTNNFVLNFAVTLPLLENVNFAVLQKKFNIPEKYYFVPNQFWAHKNHIVILKALKHLKQNSNIKVVFSGKQEDFRNPEYFNSLTKYVVEEKLEDRVLFLGFLPRTEQLSIMKNALAVIQPSLFEGWSTVVEDTKALNQRIIVSDISVHKEQLNKNATFFNPKNDMELSEIMLNYWKNSPKIEIFDYQLNILKYAHDYMEVILK